MMGKGVYIKNCTEYPRIHSTHLFTEIDTHSNLTTCLEHTLQDRAAWGPVTSQDFLVELINCFMCEIVTAQGFLIFIFIDEYN